MFPRIALLVASIVILSSCARNPVVPEQRAEGPDEGAIKALPGSPTEGATSSEMGQIPVEVNGEVEQWIRYFQGRGRGHFERYLERSTRYTPLMKKILKENGVPEDLIYICMIESGFSSKIKSRAKATGFWQFMKGTGTNYGLRVNSLIDERYDPVRSTEAAAAYFKGLYNLFNSWFLAIASYNVGENRVKYLVMKNYTRDFWELARRKQLPAETIHYIPKFIAASLIAREPEKYGFVNLDYQQPMVFDTITSKEAVDMKVLASSMKISYKELQDLNHAYKTQYAPIIDGEASVRVPKGMAEEAKVALSGAVVKNKRFLAQVEVPRAKGSFLRYRIQKGESLETIAERFDTSVEEIVKVNGNRRSRLKPGRTIKIPSNAVTVQNTPRNQVFRKKQESQETVLKHVVKRGETLSGIANRHGVTQNSIARANNLGSKQRIYYGQRLVIPTAN